MPLDSKTKTEINRDVLNNLSGVLSGKVLTHKDLQEFLKTLSSTIKQLKRQLRSETEASKKEMSQSLNSALTKLTEAEKQMEDKLEKKSKQHASDVEQARRSVQEVRKEITELQRAMDGKEQTLSERIDEINRLVESIAVPSTEDIQKVITDNLTQYGRLLRDGLETLEGDERLDHSAIKGLEEQLTELKDRIQKKGGGGAMNPIGDRIIMDDLSDQTDGSTFTFNLVRRPMNVEHKFIVYGSDFPTILRQGTDFTVANKQLTLDSNQVNAPSNGATLIAQYAV